MWGGLLLWLVLATPAARGFLEASMSLQMLVQMPLLGLAGYLLARHLPERVRRVLASWDRGGVSGLLLAAVVSLPWMLPRLMDAALAAPWVELAKFTSLPLLIGLPLALSWPRAGLVVRGVFLMEMVATAFRVGWLYLVAPQQLCVNYLVDDQQRLGTALLVLGVLATLVLACQLMWGHPRGAALR
ncbi:MAG: hypothetical protein H3C57_04850 [Gammaproteobacteria bacterium]|nr:hypothetical protein [Gammaproteobacteria bacterium]